MIDLLSYKTVIHYSLHILAPMLLALAWGKKRWLKTYLIMLATMLVDLDHLFANPVFDPNRLSVSFHPLHSYIAIAVYVVLCLLPYKKMKWPWWLRPIGVALVFHMLTDLQDFYLY